MCFDCFASVGRDLIGAAVRTRETKNSRACHRFSVPRTSWELASWNGVRAGVKAVQFVESCLWQSYHPAVPFPPMRRRIMLQGWRIAWLWTAAPSKNHFAQVFTIFRAGFARATTRDANVHWRSTGRRDFLSTCVEIYTRPTLLSLEDPQVATIRPVPIPHRPQMASRIAAAARGSIGG